MPKTKKEGIIFGIIMSMSMAYGMEVYNAAIKMGLNTTAGGFSNMTNIVFWDALVEASCHLGGNRSEELPYGSDLESLWSRTIYKTCIPKYFQTRKINLSYINNTLPLYIFTKRIYRGKFHPDHIKFFHLYGRSKIALTALPKCTAYSASYFRIVPSEASILYSYSFLPL